MFGDFEKIFWANFLIPIIPKGYIPKKKKPKNFFTRIFWENIVPQNFLSINPIGIFGPRGFLK